MTPARPRQRRLLFIQRVSAHHVARCTLCTGCYSLRCPWRHAVCRRLRGSETRRPLPVATRRPHLRLELRGKVAPIASSTEPKWQALHVVLQSGIGTSSRQSEAWCVIALLRRVCTQPVSNCVTRRRRCVRHLQPPGVRRGSPRTRTDFGSHAARFADLGRGSGRGREPRSPASRGHGNGLTSREQLRDTLLATPYASLEHATTRHGHNAASSRHRRGAAGRDGGAEPNYRARQGTSTDPGVTERGSGPFDYLPPQYAKARQQARGGHITIDAFLSNHRRPRGAAAAGSGADSASFTGDDASAASSDGISEASVRTCDV